MSPIDRRSMLAIALALTLASAGLVRAQDAAPASRPTGGTALGQPKAFPYPYTFPRTPVAELVARRAKLAAAIRDGAAVVVSQEPPSLSSGSRYRPGHNILYLTGVDTDLCAYVMVVHSGKITKETLFLPKFDRSYELWNGKRIVANDEATQLTGIEDVKALGANGLSGGAVKSLETMLEEVANTVTGTVYIEAGSRPRREGTGLNLATSTRASQILDFMKSRNGKLETSGLDGLMGDLRGVKSPWEIAQIREAVRVTGEGFVRAMRQARPGMWEFEFQAIMDHAFDDFGCTGVPYYPITASGPNACTLHYTENRRQFQDGDLVLCDIAAEYGYYAADITRTFPANGKFTERQRIVYEAVRRGQAAAGAALRPGIDLGSLDQICRKAMAAAGLKDSEMHPHGLSHHVGLDVHDLGGFMMKPGMLITIEPGSYLKREGFGVRIEDVYLVTETGSECISSAIPREVEEIEALVGAAWRASK